MTTRTFTTALRPGETFLAARQHLREHPQNMRRFYRQSDLTEMAGSLAAYAQTHPHGNMHSLLVVPADGAELRLAHADSLPQLAQGALYVVDGNVRYRAGAMLADACPPYKCELVTMAQAEQLLAMTISNNLRYAPDAISEALHYQRLVRDEGLTHADIAALTGVSAATVSKRLALLDLDPEIQELVAAEDLPSDERAAKAFLSIASKPARVKLAQRAAAEKMSIAQIVQACKTLNQAVAKREAEKNAVPMMGHASGQAGRRVPHAAHTASQSVPWEEVRDAAGAMCHACEIKQTQLQGVREPAWALLAHAAGDTCNNCAVRDLADACKQCPGVELLRRLILATVPGNEHGTGTH